MVASRLADPLDSAWSVDQQAHIAGTLQRNLLPPRLPTIDGIDLAARYLPAGVSSVGGDFYDVFSIGDNSWAILIGDACGTGPNVAALSSIARHTVRAAARHGKDHHEVIDWLNQAIASLRPRPVLHRLLRDPHARRRLWCSKPTAAGHPLPILFRATGATTTRPQRHPARRLRPHRLPRRGNRTGGGRRVVLYTDGVTDLPPPYGLATQALHDLVATRAGTLDANGIADAIEGSSSSGSLSHPASTMSPWS